MDSNHGFQGFGIAATWYLYGFVLPAGIANAVQAGQNGTLAKSVSQPLTTGLVVGIGAASSIMEVGLVSRRLMIGGVAPVARF